MIRIASLCLVVALFCVQNRSISQCEWQVQWASTDGRITNAICFVDSLHGWVGRHPLVRDGILRTTNGGMTWDTLNFSFNIGDIGSVSFIDTVSGWASDYSLGEIYRSNDGGNSWVEIYKAPNPHLFPSIIQFVDSLFGFGVGRDTSFNVTRVWKSTDGGKTWSSDILSGTVYYQMYFVDHAHGWIVGEGIYSTDDTGRTWHPQPYPIDAKTLGGVYFRTQMEGWSCSRVDGGWIIHTLDGGVTWDKQAYIAPSPYPNRLTQISFTDSLNGWVFGFTFYEGNVKGVIFRTTDGGFSWSQESVGLSAALVNGVAIDECHVWAISNLDGVILTYDTPTAVDQVSLGLPETIRLSQNYPNPFNPSTLIEYSMPRREKISIKVYDATGKVITTLLDEIKGPGSYSAWFNTVNLASGTYYFQLVTESAVVVRKAVLLR